MKGMHIDSVVKHFREKKILSDIYLHCLPGEIIALLGRNGSGKSTLMKIIFGSMGADHAYVRIDGKVCIERAGRPVAYLSQDAFLPPNLKVRTVVKLLKVEHLTTYAALQPLLNQKIAQLSGGELRYLEILFILHRPVPYILLDEPFNGLSPLMKEQIKQEILHVAKQGKGIVLTDHDYRGVLAISTKKYILQAGAMKAFNNNEELRLYGYLP